jgi:N-acetylmuramoyl-L-alanine amidase
VIFREYLWNLIKKEIYVKRYVKNVRRKWALQVNEKNNYWTQNYLNEAIQKENNRVAKTIENIYIIKHVEIPITIVECGFLSNPTEEKKLLEDDYQNRLAWGIYNGIMEYF